MYLWPTWANILRQREEWKEATVFYEAKKEARKEEERQRKAREEEERTSAIVALELCCYRCEQEEEERARMEFGWEYHQELQRVIKDDPEDKEWQALHRGQLMVDLFRLAFNEWLLVTWKSRRDRNKYWEGVFD